MVMLSWRHRPESGPCMARDLQQDTGTKHQCKNLRNYLHAAGYTVPIPRKCCYGCNGLQFTCKCVVLNGTSLYSVMNRDFAFRLLTENTGLGLDKVNVMISLTSYSVTDVALGVMGWAGISWNGKTGLVMAK